MVACGTAVFTASGDVDTQLGAGSARAAAASGGGLPVAYHRVPGGGGQGGGGPTGKAPAEALEEMQRQHRQLQEAPPAALPNPFAIGHDVRLGGSRGDGGGGPAFMPLPAAEEAWPPASQSGGLRSGAASPLSIEAPPAVVGTVPGSPLGGSGTPRRDSFDIAADR